MADMPTTARNPDHRPCRLAEWLGARTPAKTSLAQQDVETLLDRDPLPLPEHVGLWLDRALIPLTGQAGTGDGAQGKGEQLGKRALFRVAIRALSPGWETRAVQTYRPFLERYRKAALGKTPGSRRNVFEMEAAARILLHPSTGATVTEGSVLLHHTYGVPYIPGTALKGVCRATARRHVPDDVVRALFGWVQDGLEGQEGQLDNEDKAYAGLVDFWDALWVPTAPRGGVSPSALALDVVTPHHGDYYTIPTGESAKPRPAPAETDSPVPSQTLTVAPGTRFLVVLEFADVPGIDAWVPRVKEWLTEALQVHGVGAKTAAGYGRLKPLEQARPASAGPQPTPGSGPKKRAQAVYTPPQKGEEEAWVLYKKNTGDLVANMGRYSAVARGDHARALFDALPETVRTRLRRGKSFRSRIRWSAEGRAKRLDEILLD